MDGTYELFRHYYGAPAHRTAGNEEVGATRAVLGSLLGMLEAGATHMGVATDHVIESWRNDAWPAYKSSAGVPPDLLGQFPLFEEALASMGLVVWAMTDLEADDALASAAAVVPDDPRAHQVVICTPDKDLGQCVRGEKVVCLDRRKNAIVNEEAVRARFGVGPESVPDWLALVGDSADGFPGVPGWGPRRRRPSSAATPPSKPSRPSPQTGRCLCRPAGWRHWLPRWHTTGTPPNCSRSWPHAWSTGISSPPAPPRSTAWPGPARRPGLPTCAGGWKSRHC